MTRIFAATFVVWLAYSSVTAAPENTARVEVAKLDGSPVYHWRAFDSELKDDVDRALVLREFERRGFKLPERLVEKAVQEAIKTKTEGDENKFVELLRRRGATLADHRRFIAEEITIAAMLYPKTPAQRTEIHWLEGQRAHAHVTWLRTIPKDGK